MSTRAVCRWARLVFLIVLAACEPDPIGPRDGDDFVPRERLTLRVLGQGVVSERYSAEVAVRDDWAYTTTWSQRAAPGNVVKVWSVADTVPELVDSLVVADALTLGDVQISDDGALLIVATEFQPGSIVIYDRSDPAHPVQLSRFGNANTFRGVHTAKLGRVDGSLYAFLSTDGTDSGLVIVDLSNPDQPVEVFAREMGRPFIHDVFVRDGILFTALWDDGLGIWDIGGGGAGGSPVNPVELARIETVGGNVHNVWWYHSPDGEKRYAFVGEEASGGTIGVASFGDVHVVDVSDLRDPREVAFFSVGGAGTHNFTMDEAAGLLFAAYYNGGVRVLDMRGDLSSCSASQRAPDGRCDLALMEREVGVGLVDLSVNVSVWGVALVGSRLYASDMINGLYVLDRSPLP